MDFFKKDARLEINASGLKVKLCKILILNAQLPNVEDEH